MKEDEIMSLRRELETVDKRLTEKSDQLGRCESVIDHLTTEVKEGQDDLNKAIDKIAQYEHNLVNYKEQVALLQHEVRVKGHIATQGHSTTALDYAVPIQSQIFLLTSDLGVFIEFPVEKVKS